MFIKIENNKIVPIEDPSTIGSDPTIVEVSQNIPPYIKGRQVVNFIGINISVTPPVANYSILDMPVNERKLYLINQIEFQKSKNRISLETAFQRIDQITSCITHDDIDAYEASLT